MKYDVTFGTRHPEERKVVGQAETKEDVYKVIADILKQARYKSYYYNITPDKERHEWCIDFGSWSYFFFVSDEIDLCPKTEKEVA